MDQPDPLLQPLQLGQNATRTIAARKADGLALALLAKTSLTQERIQSQYETKIEHRSLLLLPTMRVPDSRELKAQKELQRLKRKRKPRPLSAREKRLHGMHKLPEAAKDYGLFEKLHKMWTSYIREIITGGGYEAKLLKADYHGARLHVTKCSCPSLVFLTGIVVKETRHTFVICTKENKLKTIPKKSTVFQFEVYLDEALQSTTSEGTGSMPQIKPMTWEIYGEHFGYRAAERVGKKFKGKHTVDF